LYVPPGTKEDEQQFVFPDAPQVAARPLQLKLPPASVPLLPELLPELSPLPLLLPSSPESVPLEDPLPPPLPDPELLELPLLEPESLPDPEPPPLLPESESLLLPPSKPLRSWKPHTSAHAAMASAESA
jgi:hypothetical protein